VRHASSSRHQNGSVNCRGWSRVIRLLWAAVGRRQATAIKTADR